MLKLVTVSLLIVVALPCVQLQNNLHVEWDKFKSEFDKTYNSAKEAVRKKIFANTHSTITIHNKNARNSYTMGHNHFSDMTEVEKSMYLGTELALADNPRKVSYSITTRQLPTSIDYRKDPCLPPIKDQGSCGSCWAFSAIAPLEFSKCKKSGTPITLSEQQLVDCDTGNSGCNGGWYTTAWNYLKAGSASSAAYPYTAMKSACKFDSSTMTVARTSTWSNVASKRPTIMQSALVTNGPLAVAMTVVPSFYNYKSGVYKDSSCTNKPVNHGVVVVGYGRQNSDDYWIVRNSWGTTWGESGYFRIKRGVNMCNIETYPAFVAAA